MGKKGNKNKNKDRIYDLEQQTLQFMGQMIDFMETTTEFIQEVNEWRENLEENLERRLDEQLERATDIDGVELLDWTRILRDDQSRTNVTLVQLDWAIKALEARYEEWKQYYLVSPEQDKIDGVNVMLDAFQSKYPSTFEALRKRQLRADIDATRRPDPDLETLLAQPDPELEALLAEEREEEINFLKREAERKIASSLRLEPGNLWLEPEKPEKEWHLWLIEPSGESPEQDHASVEAIEAAIEAGIRHRTIEAARFRHPSAGSSDGGFAGWSGRLSAVEPSNQAIVEDKEPT